MCVSVHVRESANVRDSNLQRMINRNSMLEISMYIIKHGHVYLSMGVCVRVNVSEHEYALVRASVHVFMFICLCMS